MNKFIKQVIEEKFASKAQQRYFYAQAGKGGKKGKKWAKWAKEFSADTDFEKIPEKVEKQEEVDEIVDKNGNIKRGNKPYDLATKGITQKRTTDIVVKTGAGNMGTHGVHGTHTSLRYWAEGRKSLKNLIEIELKHALGFEETMGDDEPMEKAEKYMEKDLGLSDEEAEDRLKQMGYDEELAKFDKVRLVENPKKFIEEFIESILKNKSSVNDIVNSNSTDLKEVNPLIKRQLKSLRDTLESHGLSLDDVKEYFKDNE